MRTKRLSLKRVFYAIGCSVGLILANATEVEARYNALYFDAKFDMTNHRLVIDTKSYDTANGEGPEDKYIEDGTLIFNKDGTSEVVKASRNSSEYYNAMAPKKVGQHYENKKLDKLIKDFTTGRAGGAATTLTSKKNTVPAGEYTYVDKSGATVTHKGLSMSSKRAQILKSATSGVEDREDKGMSMAYSFNILLEKIEILRGSYTDATFKETVKGLAWLIHHGGSGDEIVFKVTGSSKAEEPVKEASGSTEEDEEKIDPSDDDYPGDGTDITVKIGDVTSYKKEVEIWQSKKELKSVMQIYRLETGYRTNSVGADGSASIRFEDAKEEGEVSNFKAKAQEGLKGIRPHDIRYIQLYDLVFEAFVKLENNITASGSGDSDDVLTNMVVGAVDGILGLIETGVGLTRMEDLVYNLANREHKTYEDGWELGMFPVAWKTLINQCMGIVMLLSTMFLIFAILRILFLLNLDSMNISTRLNLKQDIMNVICCVFGMILLPTVFYILAAFNYKITELLFNALADPSIDFFSSFSEGSSLVAQIIMRITMISVKTYLNVAYVLRALNLAVLLVLGPLFVVGTAFVGVDRIKTYAREVVGNIFLQSFHALVIWFIIEAKASMGAVDGGVGLFISIALASSIIPVTEMFRELVFGKSGTLSSFGVGRITRQAEGAVKGMVSTAIGMGGFIAGDENRGIGGLVSGNSKAGKSIRKMADKVLGGGDSINDKNGKFEGDSINTGNKIDGVGGSDDAGTKGTNSVETNGTETEGGDDTTKIETKDVNGEKENQKNGGGSSSGGSDDTGAKDTNNKKTNRTKDTSNKKTNRTNKNRKKGGGAITGKIGKALAKAGTAAALDGPSPVGDVIGAVSLGIDVVDIGSEIITGKGVGEHLKDGAEAVGEKIKDVGEAIGDGFEALGDKLEDGLKDIFKGDNDK